MLNKLAEFRKEQNKTMQEMALKLGISLSLYIKVESGERNPSYSFLTKFKTAYPNADINGIFFTINVHEKCREAID